MGEVGKRKKIKYEMVSICSIKKSWKQINSSCSSGNSEKPMGLRWSLLPIGINWNVMIECKALNLLLLVAFPNLQWKSMAQLGPGASISGLCFKKWTVRMEKHSLILCRFLWPLLKRMQFWNVHCYGLSAISSLELCCDQPVHDKYMAAFLDDSDAPFEIAAFCTWGLQETLLIRW